MPIKLKAALVTLVIATCVADLVVILAYHPRLVPYVCFIFSGCMFTVLIYHLALQLLSSGAEKKGGEHG